MMGSKACGRSRWTVALRMKEPASTVGAILRRRDTLRLYRVRVGPNLPTRAEEAI